MCTYGMYISEVGECCQPVNFFVFVYPPPNPILILILS